MPLQATSGAASYDAFGGGVPSEPNYIESVFQTYLYTGNGSTQTITNGIALSTKGGLVWLKARSLAQGHTITDTVRGSNYVLQPNTTDAQVNTGSLYVSAFNTNGFSIGTGSNTSSQTFASWTFREQPKFFDVVTYTGTGANATIAHNLGAVPGMIIVKQTDTARSWQVYHRSLSAGQYLELNTTAAAGTDATEFRATPDATSFYLGTSASVNQSGGTYVAYLFAHDAGGFGLTGTDNVISCGSYTGNGSTTGPTVNLSYEPQWLLVKNAGGSGNWFIFDNMRGIPTGGDTSYLTANLATAEGTALANAIDLSATGFQIKTTSSALNTSGSTYIYIAIRRGPMKVPTSGTSVFLPTASSAAQGTVITTGWPVDQQLIAVRAGNALNFRALSRLQGVSTTNTAGNTQYLSTASTNPESANSTAGRDWDNTGYDIPDVFNTTSCIYYAFKRAPSFFDEVCYTGTGSATTVAHNLQAVPELIICKQRSGVRDWGTGWASLGWTARGPALNSTETSFTVSTWWNNTAPTSSVFTVGTSATTNQSGQTFVAYLFATCAGVSKVGSYTGTGTTLQVNCGFTGGARFVLIKRTDSTGDWYVWDSARGIVSGNDPYLLLNSTAAEVTSTDYVDTYSAGFEISSTAPAAINASGGTFIFLAIA